MVASFGSPMGLPPTACERPHARASWQGNAVARPSACCNGSCCRPTPIVPGRWAYAGSLALVRPLVCSSSTPKERPTRRITSCRWGYPMSQQRPAHLASRHRGRRSRVSVTGDARDRGRHVGPCRAAHPALRRVPSACGRRPGSPHAAPPRAPAAQCMRDGVDVTTPDHAGPIDNHAMRALHARASGV